MLTISLNGGMTRATDVPATRVSLPFSIGLGIGNLITDDTLGLVIATGVSNYAVPFGSITSASVVAVLTDQDITLKLNGDTTGFVVKKSGQMILMGSAITAATISNSSGNVANVLFYLAGITT